MTLFVTFDASRLTDVALVTVTPVTLSQANLYNTALSYSFCQSPERELSQTLYFIAFNFLL